jgi:hypothetical protein
MPLDNQELRELYNTFATRADISAMQHTLASILAKVEVIVPKDTHEMVWRSDAEWRRQTAERLELLRTHLDIIRSGDAAWAQDVRHSLQSLREDVDSGNLTWHLRLVEDVEALKTERIPARIFMIAGWIVPPLMTYLILGHHL